MSDEEGEAGAGDLARQVGERNDLLRQARLRRPSPNDLTRSMSQRELAEAVTTYVFRTTQRVVALDRHYISRLERGRSRWPIADYRNAFRAVLGAPTDAELGFYVKRRGVKPRQASLTSMAGAASELTVQPIGSDSSALQFVIGPGTAIVLVPVNRAMLSVLIPATSSTPLQG